jgi:ribosome silencing factor RsfS/YbeB/iojap
LLFQNTDKLVPVKKKAKTTTTKAGERSAGALKTKRSAKAKGSAGLKGAAGAKVAADADLSSKLKVSAKPKKTAAPMQARADSLKAVVIKALEDMKALEIKVLDVRGLTDVADTMVIASGTSDRHVRSVAQNVVEKTKQAGFRPHGVEGQQDSDWVLIDLHDMIVHVMLPRVREFYGLEKLWDMTATKRAARA